jgi:class 3 adenylate cyclase
VKARRPLSFSEHPSSLDLVAICSNCGRESQGDFAFCPYCAAPLEAAPRSREQRKTVTVLFCDVTGSTALGESTDPEALRSLLARYFERMKGIIESHGGTVEKFIGDAVMAVFGVHHAPGLGFPSLPSRHSAPEGEFTARWAKSETVAASRRRKRPPRTSPGLTQVSGVLSVFVLPGDSRR